MRRKPGKPPLWPASRRASTYQAAVHCSRQAVQGSLSRTAAGRQTREPLGPRAPAPRPTQRRKGRRSWVFPAPPRRPWLPASFLAARPGPPERYTPGGLGACRLPDTRPRGYPLRVPSGPIVEGPCLPGGSRCRILRWGPSLPMLGSGLLLPQGPGNCRRPLRQADSRASRTFWVGVTRVTAPRVLTVSWFAVNPGWVVRVRACAVFLVGIPVLLMFWGLPTSSPLPEVQNLSDPVIVLEFGTFPVLL